MSAFGVGTDMFCYHPKSLLIAKSGPLDVSLMFEIFQKRLYEYLTRIYRETSD